MSYSVWRDRFTRLLVGVFVFGQSALLDSQAHTPELEPIRTMKSVCSLCDLSDTLGGNFNRCLSCLDEEIAGNAVLRYDDVTRSVYKISQATETLKTSTYFEDPSMEYAKYEDTVFITVNYTGVKSINLRLRDIKVESYGTKATGKLKLLRGGGTSRRTIRLTKLAGDGLVGISIGPGTATDYLGNPIPAIGGSSTIVVDNTPPTVRVSSPSVKKTTFGPVSWIVTYHDRCHDYAETLTDDSISLELDGVPVKWNKTIENLGPRTVKVTVTKTLGTGLLVMKVVEGSVSDIPGNDALEALGSVRIVPPANVIIPGFTSHDAGSNSQ